MTKKFIATEIINAARWSPMSKEQNIKHALRKDKAYLERVYASFVNDPDNALFYATLISF